MKQPLTRRLQVSTLLVAILTALIAEGLRRHGKDMKRGLAALGRS